MASIATQAKQGQWMTWEDAMGRSLSWPEIWSTDQSKLSFMIRSFADLLPSPSNLKLWGSLDSANCSLCNSPDCTLNHILSACPKALSEGRYTWRHNKVLREIADIVDKQRLLANQGSPTTSVQSVNFVREGQSGFSGSRRSLTVKIVQ